MKATWEDLITATDKKRGFEISVPPKRVALVTVLRGILRQNKVPVILRVTVLSNGSIRSKTTLKKREAIKWLRKITSEENVQALRCSLRKGCCILVTEEELFGEKK